MANQWLRLWHDMPTDPKWRTIAKVSGQRIGDVIAVYAHILVAASTATERGRTHALKSEDVASALDLETVDVDSILAAMQGRVLDGDQVQGWEKRQPLREDGSAERARAHREAKKAAKDGDSSSSGGDSNAAERSRTQAERNQPPDKDTDKDTEEKKEEPSLRSGSSASPAKPAKPAKPSGYTEDFETAWREYPDRTGHSKAEAFKAWNARLAAGATAEILTDGVRRYAAYCAAERTEPRFVKHAATFFGPDRHYESDWTPRQQPPQHTGQAPPPNRQEALEQRNRASASEWAAKKKRELEAANAAE